jgi:uncharacterized repeat protein (TIGR01451 family)
MNENTSVPHAMKVTRPLSKLVLLAAPVIFLSIPAGAQTQTALSGSDLILPATAAPNTDMVNLKTANADGRDSYSVLITNTGPVAVTGAVVTDSADNGRNCPRSNAVTITGNGVPEGSFKVANLVNPGIALGTLQPGQSATLTYSCQVN